MVIVGVVSCVLPCAVLLRRHGGPRGTAQVLWEHVRALPDGECVSVAGTHLGHNLPDERGNRYCINIVSVAGLPPA